MFNLCAVEQRGFWLRASLFQVQDEEASSKLKHKLEHPGQGEGGEQVRGQADQGGEEVEGVRLQHLRLHNH